MKQKTPYEVRISDWRSGVCSSDLAAVRAHVPELGKRFPRGNIVSLGLIGFFVLLGIASLWLPYRIATPLAPRVVLVGVLWIAVAGIVGVRRSAGRRVGKGWVRPCRFRCAPDHLKKKKIPMT